MGGRDELLGLALGRVAVLRGLLLGEAEESEAEIMALAAARVNRKTLRRLVAITSSQSSSVISQSGFCTRIPAAQTSASILPKCSTKFMICLLI